MSAMPLPPTPSPALSLPDSVDAVIELLAAENYVCDRQLGTALFLALKLARPLFLEGAPGVGKTELAKTLARALNTQLLRVQCYEGLDVAQTAYEWNVARQMIEIRLAEAAHEVDRAALARSLYARSMLIERPLLQALTQTRSPVLLIDELDRADEPFDAFLLEVLAENQLTIPEYGTVVATAPPITLITSNRTREIHDALRRRCLYHWVGYPSVERELDIVRLKAPGASERLVPSGGGVRAAHARAGSVQVPRRCRDHRLDPCAAGAEQPAARRGQRAGHAGRAAQASGRHRRRCTAANTAKLLDELRAKALL